jgi:signal transduction histidine kinase
MIEKSRRSGAERLLRLLFAVAIVAPPLIFGWAAWLSHDQLVTETQRDARATARVLRQHALRVLDFHVLALEEIDERAAGLGWDAIEQSPDLHRYLARLSRVLGGESTLWLTDATGRARASSLAFPVPALDVSDREYFIEQKRRDAGIFVSVPYERRTGEKTWAFGVSRRRSAAADRFDGTVHVAINTEYFTRFWREVASSKGVPYVVPIIREDGELLVRYPNAIGQRLRLAPTAPFMQAIAREPGSGLYTAESRIDGIERVNAYEKIGEYPLYISYSIETEAVLGPWRRSLAFYGAIVLLAWTGLVATTWQVLQQTKREAAALARLREEVTRREATEEQLRQAQKMEAVGRLTGGIAHDFNNLLTIIVGSLDMLGRRIADADARARGLIDNAMEGANRAANLTQRLLAFSRRQPLDPKPIDANKLVTAMSELLRRSLGELVSIETVLAGGLWPTFADPNQLENAILNLAVNAKDAMAEGGRLTIETSNAHLDEAYASGHDDVRPGQYVLIAVSDTGAGMPPNVAARAFEPFYTTKESGKGTGLGLSQVYGFVKQSGGHVKIYSELGQGTAVKIYLPRYTGDFIVSGASDQDRDARNAGRNETILVVEDEDAVRSVTVEALGELGYRVLEADGGAAALRILDANPDVALLLSDVVMPDVNGAKLAAEALSRRPDLKIVFMTGYTRNAVVHNGVLDPGTQLISKPFTQEQLAAKLREVLES